jgi:hypothetical protein
LDKQASLDSRAGRRFQGFSPYLISNFQDETKVVNMSENKLNELEMVNHPAHYGSDDDPYEAIKVIEAWKLDFCLGNTVKYISRAGKKPGASLLQDLEKASWYLNRKIRALKAIQSKEPVQR